LARRRYPAKATKRVSGPLATANREIREAERLGEQRQLARSTEPRRLTDRLLSQLEELNLDGEATVPDSYEPTLAELRAHLVDQRGVGSRLIERLQSGMSTTELIATVFTIQEIISPPTLPPGALPNEDAESI
jgi:hypothetical protein